MSTSTKFFLFALILALCQIGSAQPIKPGDKASSLEGFFVRAASNSYAGMYRFEIGDYCAIMPDEIMTVRGIYKNDEILLEAEGPDQKILASQLRGIACPHGTLFFVSRVRWNEIVAEQNAGDDNGRRAFAEQMQKDRIAAEEAAKPAACKEFEHSRVLYFDLPEDPSENKMGKKEREAHHAERVRARAEELEKLEAACTAALTKQ